VATRYPAAIAEAPIIRSCAPKLAPFARGPERGVDPSPHEVEWNHREQGQQPLDEALAALPLRGPGRTTSAVQQLGGRDRGRELSLAPVASRHSTISMGGSRLTRQRPAGVDD
jgi:hypothetical protein